MQPRTTREPIDDGWVLPDEAPLRPLDLNAASFDELRHLPHIGPLRARRILAARERRGGFHSVDDLASINGIGVKMLDLLRDRLTVRAP